MQAPTPVPSPAPMAVQTDPGLAQAAVRGDKRRRLLDERRRSFLRMVSHELRTPLNTVIGFSEIIACELYGPLGAPQYKEYAEIVRQSGHRLLKLVNQVIEIARLEDGVVELDVRHEAVEPLIDEVLGAMKDDIAARRLHLEIDRACMPTVYADSRGLRTMLTNLMQNAVTHSPEGGLLEIRCRRAGAASVEIEIEDHGPGVDSEQLPRMLKPFEQGGDALTRPSQGAGLGLPITQLLAKAMGGHLRLRSLPGQGLIATVVLPAA